MQNVRIEELLATALKVLGHNHRYLSNNIANVDTPGFKPTHVDFAESLKAALREHDLLSGTASADAVPRWLVFESEDGSGSMGIRNDFSGVDVERELALLEKNTMTYSVVSALLAKRFRSIKSALRNLK